jgi:hypothetical protein
MATTPMTPAATPPIYKKNRGKDQIQWGDSIWQALDDAVLDEMMRTRVAAKFLPQVNVDKKQTTVASDVVVVPGAAPDVLSIDESATTRIQEYFVQFRLTPAQTEAEAQEEMVMSYQMGPSHPQEPATTSRPQMMKSHPHRASTAVSLALASANIAAQAEDLVLFSGQNAVVNAPLFTGNRVQSLDTNLKTNLDLGLLNITSDGTITLPGTSTATTISQVVQVHPTVAATQGSPPLYRENTLNAVASAFSQLQALGHYEHYALALNTIPYADLHEALPSTLIEPVEPISHIVKAGVHGSGTLPPFTAAGAGLPTKISDGTKIDGKVLYTGVLVSLGGNTMDLVRGRMDDQLDAVVTFNQKDVNENFRFRVVQRFALRLKDPTAVILLLFLDTVLD